MSVNWCSSNLAVAATVCSAQQTVGAITAAGLAQSHGSQPHAEAALAAEPKLHIPEQKLWGVCRVRAGDGDETRGVRARHYLII